LDIEIISKRENHFLKRIEIKFQAIHPKEPTPDREKLRTQLAKEFSSKKDNVILDWIKSEFGTTITVGYAKVYKSMEDALRIERKPILIRMGLIAPEKEEKPKEKKEPPPKKEEAKPEEKPEKKEEAKAPAKPKEEKAVPSEKVKKGEGKKEDEKKSTKGGK